VQSLADQGTIRSFKSLASTGFATRALTSATQIWRRKLLRRNARVTRRAPFVPHPQPLRWSSPVLFRTV
jgi:hypothetical protein